MGTRHKALRALHERDDAARLPAGLVPRLRRTVFRLQEAMHRGRADAPGFQRLSLHRLSANGKPSGARLRADGTA